MGTFKLRTINQRFENSTDTSVPFEREIVDVAGRNVEGVFAQFRSYATIQLDEYYLSDEFYASNPSSYRAQMSQATRQLREMISLDESLKDNFSEQALCDIENGRPKIDNMTWHHHHEHGRMDLVDTQEHKKYKHTGGSYMWNYSKFSKKFSDWDH